MVKTKSIGNYFKKPNGRAVIIRAKNNDCFYYLFNLLSELSTFFRDLDSLSEHHHTTTTDESSTSDTPIFPLPSASSAALFYALCLIDSLTKCEPSPRLDTDILHDIVTLADAYQLPIIISGSIGVYAQSPSPSPFGFYALSVLAKDEERAKQWSKVTLPRTSHNSKSKNENGILDMPEWVEKVLDKWSPAHLTRLYKLHSVRPIALARLEEKLHSQIVLGQPKKIKHGDWKRTCDEAFGYEGSMEDYNATIVSPIIKRVRENWQPSLDRMFEDGASSDSDVCGACLKDAQKLWAPKIKDIL